MSFSPLERLLINLGEKRRNATKWELKVLIAIVSIFSENMIETSWESLGEQVWKTKYIKNPSN